MDGKRVLVIDAGLAGLVAAIRLARDGARVTLLERSAERPPRDAFTCPLWVADLYAYAGEDVREWMQIERVEPLETVRKEHAPGYEKLSRHASSEWSRFLQTGLIPEAATGEWIGRNFLNVLRARLPRPRRSLMDVVEATISEPDARQTVYELLGGLEFDPGEIPGRNVMWLHAGNVNGWWKIRGGPPIHAALAALATRGGTTFIEDACEDSRELQDFDVTISLASGPEADAGQARIDFRERSFVQPACFDPMRRAVTIHPLAERFGGVAMAIIAGRQASLLARELVRETLPK